MMRNFITVIALTISCSCFSQELMDSMQNVKYKMTLTADYLRVDTLDFDDLRDSNWVAIEVNSSNTGDFLVNMSKYYIRNAFIIDSNSTFLPELSDGWTRITSLWLWYPKLESVSNFNSLNNLSDLQIISKRIKTLPNDFLALCPLKTLSLIINRRANLESITKIQELELFSTNIKITKRSVVTLKEIQSKTLIIFITQRVNKHFGELEKFDSTYIYGSLNRRELKRLNSILPKAQYREAVNW